MHVSIQFPQSKDCMSRLSIAFSLKDYPFDFISHGYDLKTWCFCLLIFNYSFTLGYSEELNNNNNIPPHPILKLAK